MKRNKKINMRPIALGTAVTAGVAATVFAINAGAIHSIQNHFGKVNGIAHEATTNPILSPTNKPLYAPRVAEKAPKNLFVIAPANGALTYDQPVEIEQNIQPLLDGVNNLGFPDDIFDPFAMAYRDAFFKTQPYIYNKFPQAVDKGIAFYTDLNNIQKKFISMNQFHTSTNELEIYKPDFIYDINAAGATGIDALVTANNRSSFEKTPSNVKYTVASIDMTSLKDQDQVLDYVIKVPNKTGTPVTYKEYHLLINNNQNQVVKEFDTVLNPAATMDVNKLFNEGKIILRDMNKEVTASSLVEKLTNLLSLNFNGSALKINVNTEGYDDSHAIKFKSADSKTASLSQVGFLDSSESPLHNTANTGATPFEDPTKSINDIIVRAMKAKQTTKGTSGKTFTMWMAQDSSIKFSLVYSPATGAWVNGNEMTISFDGTSVTSIPTSLSLNKGTRVPTHGLVHYDAQITTTNIDGVKYAKVEVYTDDAELEMNDNQIIRVPGKGDEKIFFEMPGHDPNLNPSLDTKIPNELKVSTSTDVTDKWREYINSVYGSWFQLDGSKPEQWKLAAPVIGTPDAVTGVDGTGRKYNFNYEFFLQNARGGIIKATPPTKDSFLTAHGVGAPESLLIKHDGTTFAPTETAGAIQTVNAFGENIAKMLSDYYNHIVKWQHDKFGITTSLKPEDFYNLVDPSDLDKVVKNIELNAPLSYANLVERSDAIVRLLWEGDGTLTSQQLRYIDGLDDPASPFHNQLGINVKALLNNAIGGSSTVNTVTGDIASWTPAMIKANKVAMMVVEREIIRALEEIFKNENTAFESIYKSLLGNSITKYLNGNGLTYDAISSTALQVVPQSVLDSRLAGQTIIALSGNPMTHVDSGRKQLKSLLDFIKNFGLQTKYLSAARASQFDTFYKSGILLDAAAYSSASDRVNVGNMITILDELIKNIISGSKIEKIGNIITDIEQGKITSDQAAIRIKDVLNKIINKIVSPSEKAFSYNVLSTEYQSSYLENQVMGKNLSGVLEAWLKEHTSSLTPTKIAQLKQQGLYDPQTLVNVAISSKFYNFDYFVEALTRRSLVPGTTHELLSSNFEDSIIFEIPHTNSIIDFMSNPNTLVRYGFLFSGILIAITGFVTFGISVTKSSRSSEGKSSRATIISRVAFLGVAVLGLIISGIGFIATL